MNSQTLSSFFFILCLFLIFHAPMPTLCDSLYESICNEVNHVNDTNKCLTLLKSNSRISSAKNYLDLSKFVLGMGIRKATHGRKYFVELMNEHPTPAIKQCATEFYFQAIEDFKRSLIEVVEYPRIANYDAAIAGDGPTNCERAIEAEKIINDTSIRSLNNEMVLLSHIAFLVTCHLAP